MAEQETSKRDSTDFPMLAPHRVAVFAVVLFLISGFGEQVSAESKSGTVADSVDKKLLDAAVHGNVEEVVRLLSEGANPDVFNDFGETPLHLAAIGGNADVVRALLSSGANVNTVTIQGAAAAHFQGNEKRTPLMWFADSCQVEGVKALLEAGADKSILNEEGEHVVAMMKGHESPSCKEVQELLSK